MSYICNHTGLGRIEHHPFGMVMKERSKSYKHYRFGFNGQEKDDEVGGNGNYLDFRARIYSSRIGRWMGVDPAFKKYPEEAPYLFAGNCPTILIDFNGKDYGVKIDNQKKTVTIVANIYTTKIDAKQVRNSAQMWNDENGKYLVEVKNVIRKGFLGIGRKVETELYDVNFEINVIAKGTFQQRSETFRMDNSGFANEMILTDDDLVDPNDNSEDVRGYTFKPGDGSNKGTSKALVEKGWQKTHQTESHEIGHMIGVPHWNIGLMVDGIRREPGEKEISRGMVNEMLANLKITTHNNITWGKNSDAWDGSSRSGAKAKYLGSDRLIGKAKVKMK